MGSRFLGCTTSVLALMGAAGVAHAQSAPPPTAQAVEEVVVTGSRIARRDFVATSPIITTSEAQLKDTGKVNIETALQQLPQFTPAQDENNNAEASGGGGRATVNLRGLGETRTLVLMDGRRLPPSNGQLVVDLNTVPIGIVEGVEVISGGASAVYGSDAIAGVVNIKTKRHFNGLQFNANYGASFKGDGDRTDLAVTAGHDFADGKGNALISLGYTDRGEVKSSSREFFRFGGPSGTLPQGAFAVTSGNLPSQAAVDTYFAQFGAAPGTVKNTTALGFNSDGTLFSGVSPITNYRGPGVDGGYTTDTGQIIYNTTRDALLTVPQKRYTFFSKLNYDLTDNIHVYAQGLYANSRVDTQIGYGPVGANINYVPVTNPFIPASLRQILASRPDPNAKFTFNKRYMFSPRRWQEDFNTYQIIAGAGGSIPGGDWTWDIYGLHDSTNLVETQKDYVSRTRIQTLLDAPDGGKSICAGGFNPFQGLGLDFSQQCIDYVSMDLHSTTRVKSDVVEGSVQGGLFELPAGQARFSAVGTYRKNAFDYSPDSVLVLGDLGSPGNTRPTSGAVSVKEIAGEVLIPLLKDLPFVKALNTTVGARYSDYDVSGGVWAYKIDGDWRINDALLIRGGYERAVRAPNISELFSAATNVTTLIGSVPAAGDPCDTRGNIRKGAQAAQVRALCLAQGIPADLIDTYVYTAGSVGTEVSGSTALKPEKADTFTIGLVFTPKFENPWLSRLMASVDYYNIKLADAISTSGAQTALSKCYNLDGSNPNYDANNLYCGLLDRRSGGAGSLRIVQPYLNLGGYKTAGVDTQVDWTLDLDEIGVGDYGRLQLTTALTYVDKFAVQQLPGDPFVDYVGTVSLPLSVTPSLPKWRALTTLKYSYGPADVGLRWRHIAAMDDVTRVTRPASPAKGVPAYDMFDVLLGWRATEKIKVNATISNITNKEPPVVAESPGNTQRGLYDVLGRTYLLNLQVTF